MAVRGRRFVVRSAHGHKYRVYADSEPVARLPAEFSIVFRGITVLVPEKSLRAIH